LFTRRQDTRFSGGRRNRQALERPNAPASSYNERARRRCRVCRVFARRQFSRKLRFGWRGPTLACCAAGGQSATMTRFMKKNFLFFLSVISLSLSLRAQSVWHQLNMPAQRYGLAGVAYGDNKYVAVGARGTVITSTDGVEWESQSTPDTSDLGD